ncbi:MAG TPA: SIS domain-containing protein [Capillimicrobium sp.]
MSEAPSSPLVWSETVAIPAVLEETLERRAGFEDVVALLREPSARRLIVTGNGASSYVAHAIWLASLAGRRPPIEVLGVPAGLLATGDLALDEGDVLLAISASGELRELIELLERRPAGVEAAAITGSPESSIGRLAAAAAVVASGPQEAVLHTHAYCGAIVVGLALLADLADDPELRDAVAGAPAAAERAIETASAWASEALPHIPTPTAAYALGSGAGWAAALETALVVKECCQIPTEGVEAREAATTAMTALLPEHLVVSLPTRDDAVAVESERICASRGAHVLRAPGGELADRRLAPITTFPAAVALAVELAGRVGVDPDKPAWTDTYYETARRSG